MLDLGPLSYFLGIKITSTADVIIFLSISMFRTCFIVLASLMIKLQLHPWS
jgi:hypothetical protein